MRYDNPQLQDQLAAEYVLGTLHGRARQRFDSLLLQYPALQTRVEHWHVRLHPLTTPIAPVTPPNRVWTAIEHELSRETVTAPRRPRLLRNNWGMLAASLVLAVSVFFGLQLQQTEKSYVVVVADQQSQPVWVVSTTATSRNFTVRTLKPAGMPPDKMCVLWLQWQDGYTHPLGVLSEESGHHTDYALGKLVRNPMKAQVVVSIEAASHEPISPTGTLVFKGDWVEL